MSKVKTPEELKNEVEESLIRSSLISIEDRTDRSRKIEIWARHKELTYHENIDMKVLGPRIETTLIEQKNMSISNGIYTVISHLYSEYEKLYKELKNDNE